MTVSEQQWNAVCRDHNLSRAELREAIQELDDRLEARLGQADFARFRDRDAEPISFGEWVYLYQAKSYRVVAVADVDCLQIVTIWRGLCSSYGEDWLFESRVTAVVLGYASELECHSFTTEVTALAGHDHLVTKAHDAADANPQVSANIPALHNVIASLSLSHGPGNSGKRTS
jgi:hypothetical protein